MQALRIEAHGPVSNLEVSQAPRPQPAEGEVLVRVEAAALNPSDLLSVLGRFPHARLPRIVGRDFAGTVVEGPDELKGTKVWGSGGDLGITRDGSHAEFLLLRRTAVARRPENLSAEEAGTAGVPFVTAWSALELGRLAAGECVLIAGAAGSVGRASIQLAKQRGARVIALVRNDAQASSIAGLPVDGVARTEAGDLPEVVKRVTGGHGCELVLNGVGAAVYPALVDALADGGRMVIFAIASGREATLDLFGFYRRRLEFLGLNTVTLGVERCAEIFRQLTPLFEAGHLRPLPVSERFALADARRAYERLEQGGAGKLVLVPGA